MQRLRRSKKSRGSFYLTEIEVPPTTLCYKGTQKVGWGSRVQFCSWSRNYLQISVRVCVYIIILFKVPPTPTSLLAVKHLTLPSSCLFCSLNLLPPPSGKRLLRNPSHINYFLFPTCPVTNLGSWRWITLHSKSALNTEFKILFTPLLVNLSP